MGKSYVHHTDHFMRTDATEKEQSRGTGGECYVYVIEELWVISLAHVDRKHV